MIKAIKFIFDNFPHIFLWACSSLSLALNLTDKLTHQQALPLTHEQASFIGGLAPYAFLSCLIVANVAIWQQKRELERKNDLYSQLVPDGYPSQEERLNQLLRFIAEKELSFNSAHRVSVYKYDPNMHIFLRIGRFSKDPQLMEGGKRAVYDKDEGVIGKAWNAENGEFELKNLPDPNTHFPAYKQALQRNGVALNDNVLAELRMRSRSYYAVRTEDNETLSINSILIFESKNPKGFSMRKIRKMLHSETGRFLAQMIADARVPSQNNGEGL